MSPSQMWMKLWNPSYSVGESTFNLTPSSVSLKVYCQHVLGWSASHTAARREREQSLIAMFRASVSAKGPENERFETLKFSELHSSNSRGGEKGPKDPKQQVHRKKKGQKGQAIMQEQQREEPKAASTLNLKADAKRTIILPFLDLEPEASEDLCNENWILDPFSDAPGSVPQWQQQMFSKDVAYADPIDLARLVGGLQDKNGLSARDHAADLCLLRTFDALTSIRHPKGSIHPVFMNAILADDVSKVLFLFQAYPDEFSFDMSDNMGRTLFHIVADCADADKCIDAIAEKLGEHSRVILDYKSHPSSSCRTALHSAAIRGHCKVIEKFLMYGACTEIFDSSGMTALDLAAKNGMFDAFKAILCRIWDRKRLEIPKTVQTMDSALRLPYINEITEAQRLFDENSSQHLQRAIDEQFLKATERWKAHFVNISDESAKKTISELRKQLLEVVTESPDTFEGTPLLIFGFSDAFKESILRLKCGLPSYLPYNIMKPSAFETEDFLKTPQALLFLCLAYSLSFASSPSDLFEQIQKFEVQCDCKAVPVLYWLAWSRCLSRQAAFSKSEGDERLAIKFLNCFAREFAKISTVNGASYGNMDDWITTEEKQKIPLDPLRLSDVALTTKLSLSTQAAANAEDWLESLSDYQREPFDELNSMIGLGEVKKTARFIFELGQSLRRNEAQRSDDTRLNFAFLGKPGSFESVSLLLQLSLTIVERLIFPCRNWQEPCVQNIQGHFASKWRPRSQVPRPVCGGGPHDGIREVFRIDIGIHW